MMITLEAITDGPINKITTGNASYQLHHALSLLDISVYHSELSKDKYRDTLDELVSHNKLKAWSEI